MFRRIVIRDPAALRFLTGVTLFAIQAEQSLVRVLPTTMDLGFLPEMRRFFSERQPDARTLAAHLTGWAWNQRGTGRSFTTSPWRLRALPYVDFFLMSRLLYDFADVVEGADRPIEDLGNLRFSLALATGPFAYKLGLNIPWPSGGINFFNRNPILGSGSEIDAVLGSGWYELPCATSR